LLISFHLVPVFSGGSSRAIPNCEYLIHKADAVIHTLFTLELTAERHFCSIFKHKKGAHPLRQLGSHNCSQPLGLDVRPCKPRKPEARISNFETNPNHEDSKTKLVRLTGDEGQALGFSGACFGFRYSDFGFPAQRSYAPERGLINRRLSM
jgi:hypothetical protein